MRTSMVPGRKGSLTMERRFLSYCTDTSDPVLIDDLIIGPKLFVLRVFYVNLGGGP